MLSGYAHGFVLLSLAILTLPFQTLAEDVFVRSVVPERSVTPSGRFVIHKNGNAGKRSRNWCLGPSTGAASAGIRGYIIPGKKIETVIAKSCSLVHFGVLEHFNNRNAVPMRDDAFRQLFDNVNGVSPRNDPW